MTTVVAKESNPAGNASWVRAYNAQLTGKLIAIVVLHTHSTSATNSLLARQLAIAQVILCQCNVFLGQRFRTTVTSFSCSAILRTHS